MGTGDRRATIVVDLGFGDAGKGALVDFLCRDEPVDLVVRYCGGSQCGHCVQLADGRRHVFSQFGSGTLAGVPAYLGPNVILNLEAMVAEATSLAKNFPEAGDPWALLTVHPDCLIATPYHRWMNQIAELARGSDRHGSCGHGIGETRRAWLNVPDSTLQVWQLKDNYISSRDRLERAYQQFLPSVYRFAADARDRDEETSAAIQELAELFLSVGPGEIANDLAALATNITIEPWAAVPWWHAVFEGAQGVLLDESHGFPPHHTWSTTTDRHARELIAEASGGFVQARTIGCVRAFSTRHGAGPFPSEDHALTVAWPDPGNLANRWQGELRVGAFDQMLHRYALTVQPVDGLAVSWLDMFNLEPEIPVCYAYDEPDRAERTTAWPASPYPVPERQHELGRRLAKCRPVVETVRTVDFFSSLGAPVWVPGRGPTAGDRWWGVAAERRW